MARYALAERANAQARLDRMWAEVESLANPSDEPLADSPLDELAESSMGLGALTPHIPTLEPGPREGQREAVQARALLEKADRVRVKAGAEDQQELDRLAGRVRDAMTDRRWGDLQTACNELSDVLFYLEDA